MRWSLCEPSSLRGREPMRVADMQCGLRSALGKQTQESTAFQQCVARFCTRRSMSGRIVQGAPCPSGLRRNEKLDYKHPSVTLLLTKRFWYLNHDAGSLCQDPPAVQEQRLRG
eukprot:729765-Rhodomonas_salina.3